MFGKSLYIKFNIVQYIFFLNIKCIIICYKPIKILIQKMFKNILFFDKKYNFDFVVIFSINI